MLEPRELLETIMIDFGLDPPAGASRCCCAIWRSIWWTSGSRDGWCCW